MTDTPHDEIEDEYQLSLAEDVEDESLLEEPSNDVFSITSYGADYPVDTLISRLKSEAFFVPTFQRQFVWSQRHASRFIESLLMGLPVPGIFLYKESQTNRHLVVDGQQRLRTLQFFYAELFGEKKFRLVGVRPEWSGKTYSELATSDKLKLDDAVVHATIFQQDEPKETNRSLYFVFERINSGGIRLSPQEIRNCINDGPLLSLVRSCNAYQDWRSLFGKMNNRLKDQEMIMRFMAMRERGADYKRPMRDFLNAFAADYANCDPIKLANLGDSFRRSITLCWQAKGTSAFRPSRVLNAAVFEAVMLGVAARLDGAKASPKHEAIAVAYDGLLANSVFLRACERATADDETVKTRRTMAVAAFAGV
ncbi:DUF262 domain-containing protein [Mesorhizobium sp. M0244]|uniref:DUF262 domain-containing protein n=1 Tax=Mesorhizobium sp. M0244 TaxID=2956926 RepID=UPI00333C0D22